MAEELPYSIPLDKLYAVVELVEDEATPDGESELVRYACPASSNWLLDVVRQVTEDGQSKYFATCKWPSSEEKLTQFLEKRSKPANDWKTFSSTRVLRFCRSIGQAKEQAEKALSNDDLSQSDVADLPRRRKPTLRFGFNHERENFDSDSDSEPPPMKSLKLNCGTKVPKRGNKMSKASTANGIVSPLKRRPGNQVNYNSDDDVVEQNNNKENFGPVSDQTSMAGMLKASGTKPKDHSSSNDHVTSVMSESPALSRETVTPNMTPHAKSPKIQQDSFLSPNSVPLRVHSSSGGATPKSMHGQFSPRKVMTGSNPVTHYTFMREMQEMRRVLHGLQISVNKIYQIICPIMESSNDNEEGRGIPALPVDSFEAMQSWETYLKDHDNSLNVVRLLSERCLNTSLKDSVYSMMRFLISNKLASAFNYRGKNKKDAKFQKRSFMDTRSCTVLSAALKSFRDRMKKNGSELNYSTAPDDVGSALGFWLKDAPKRYLIDLKAAKKVPPTAVHVPEEYIITPPACSSDNESDHDC